MRSRELAEHLARAAIDAVDPRRRTREAIERAGIEQPVTLIALGKAARGMARAALDTCDVRRGIVIAPDDAPIMAGALGQEVPDEVIVVRRGGHPTPAPDAREVGDEVLALARSLGRDDVALVLISGGGSAMLERPIEGITVEDVARASRALMHAGADIAALNAVRRCLSEIKGGGLARALAPARVVALVISDVPGHPATMVASGPCSSPEGWPDPREVLARFGTSPEISAAVRGAVARRADDPGGVHAELHVVASNEDAVEAVRLAAAARGAVLARGEGPISGDAADAGLGLVRAALGAGHGLVVGGETTVTVRGGGRGGRNQHAALAVAAAGEAALDRAVLITIGTDGRDGSSDAAGAFVDREVLARARALGLDPAAFLERCDSDAFFAGVGAQIVTGATGTNVADVWCCVLSP